MATNQDKENEKEITRQKAEQDKLNKEAVRDTKKISDNTKDTGNNYKVINNEFQSYADAIRAANVEIQGSNKSLNDAKKAYNDLTSLATQLARNQQDLGDLSKKELNDIIEKSKARRADIKDAAMGMQQELASLKKKIDDGGKLTKVEQTRKDQILALLKATGESLELEESITKEAEEQLKLEELLEQI